MNIVVIVGLIVIGLLLLLVEVFFIPGTSLAGFAAAACLIVANFFAFSTLGSLPGLITLAGSVLSVLVVVVWFMRSKSIDRLALRKNIDSSVNSTRETGVKVGDRGIALTRLALVGNAEFDDVVVEVKSVSGFIEENTPIQVVRMDESTIMVSKIK